MFLGTIVDFLLTTPFSGDRRMIYNVHWHNLIVFQVGNNLKWNLLTFFRLKKESFPFSIQSLRCLEQVRRSRFRSNVDNDDTHVAERFLTFRLIENFISLFIRDSYSISNPHLFSPIMIFWLLVIHSEVVASTGYQERLATHELT